MLQKSKAIVLHSIKYGDSGTIVYCYTECCGRLAFIVSGTRKSGSKFPSSLFQPLTIIEVIFYNKGPGNLCRIKEAALSELYCSVNENLAKSCIAIFLAEVLYRTLQEETGNPELFGFLEKSFIRLDRLTEGVSGFHIHFMLHYSGFLGIFPEGLVKADKMDTDNRDIVSFSGLNSNSLAAIVKMLKNIDYDLKEIKLSNMERNDILNCIIKYYNLHLDGILKLNSLMVLREVLS